MKAWITYAWKNNSEGNFDYLTQELKKVGIEAIYDKVALVPGQRLWEQIGNNITNGDFDGWAYLITKESLESEPCKEELAYALNRALSEKEANFPIIGLLHNVNIANVPPSLKVRLCINLSDPNWKEQFIAALNKTTSNIPAQTASRYIYDVINFANNQTLIQIKPRFEEIMYWRVGLPANTEVIDFGVGVADNTVSISGISHERLTGTLEFQNHPVLANGKMQIMGCGDKISSGIAAKIIIKGGSPEYVAFGISKDPLGQATQMEVKPLK